MKEAWKVYIRGNYKRGDEIFEALRDLGALNTTSLTGGYNEKLIYFINHFGLIDYTDTDSEKAKIIMDNYTELHLPEK